MTTAHPKLSRLLFTEQAAVLLSLLGVIALAWLTLWHMAGAMSASSTEMMGMVMTSAMPMPWRMADFALTFSMWVVMMVGMMLPSAIPMILLYQTVSRKRSPQRPVILQVAIFTCAYLLIWTGFSLSAVLLQWLLDQQALLLPTGVRNGVAGGILLLAGTYQWLPAKQACLNRCRSPLLFLVEYWRPGTAGALRMGLAHGLFCLGCCWALMGVLFVVGVMNLIWVAALSVLVLLEKLIPVGVWGHRLTGLVLIGWGLAVWVPLV